MVRIVRVLRHWGLGGGFGHLLLFDVGVLMFVLKIGRACSTEGPAGG